MTEHAEHLLPRTVENLDTIEAEWRDCYRENPTHDGFVLTTDALAQIEAGKKLLADQATEHAAELAALDTERARQTATIKKVVIARELHSALAGVRGASEGRTECARWPFSAATSSAITPPSSMCRHPEQ
jgi:hypothetical protein